MLGCNSPPQTTPAKDRPLVLPRPIEEAPMYGATLTVNNRPHSAKALNRSTQLRRRGNQVNLTVEDIHEVVILKY
jgi:hypothetical protein